MPAICLPQSVVTAFKTKLKDGTITPEKLSSMKPDERHDFIAGIVGEQSAGDINALIESKLLLKNQERGLITAVKQIIGDKPAAQRDLLARINKLDTVLSPAEEDAFMHDLASKKLGSDISLEEAQKITELAKKANDAKDVNPKMSGVSDDYLNARNELNQYVESLKPVSPGNSIGKNLAVIARNNLLLNPATPIKTAIGEIENTAIDTVTRRISDLSLRGENPDLASKAKAEAWATFRATGNNTASMESMDDTHMLGKGESFKIPTGQDESGGILRRTVGAVSTAAKISNKLAIDWTHNIPFTRFYQRAFFDMTNLASSKMAESEGLKGAELKTRAAEILKDAVKIEPQTAEGKMVRLASQRQAARVTSTNETWASRLALGTKKAMNAAIPGSGDILIPIAKIPANIVANGLDNAGVGLPKGIIDIWKGREKIQSSDIDTKLEGLIQFREGVQRVSRITGTVGAAALIASRFQKSDFRSDPYGNHFFRLGNTWINTEYLAFASPALAGFMAARANGTNIATDLAQYAGGASTNAIGIEGISTSAGADIINQGIEKYGVGFLQSRITPAILKSLFSGRALNEMLFGVHGVESDAQVKATAKAKAQATAQKAKLTREKNKAQ